MFSVCKQTHPPTGVEHSLTCNFFNRIEKSLVVANSNILRVFRLIPDVDPKKKERFGENRPPKMKLECLASFTLWGNITSIASASLAGSVRDALLLSFRDAKLSLVEYDPETHDLRTLSLHYFEEDEIRGGWTHNEHRTPLLRVDPEGRCAVMLGYGRRLIVLPFRKDPAPEDSDLLMVSASMQSDIKPLPHQLLAGGAAPSSSKAPVLASYSIALKELDEKMDNVIDVQFLHGYYEPTLLILYEPVRTFPGRLAVRKDTCCMVAISLSLATRVHPSIWSVSGLPFDCQQAVPVRKPLGGTLILATNSVIYLNQSVPPFGVSVNSFAETSSNFPLREQVGVKLTLEGAQACFLNNDRLVLSLHGGELYVLSLFADSMRSVRGFHFEKAAASVLTTCISVYEDNYLFLGSRLGNSLLLRFTEKDQTPFMDLNGIDDDVVEISADGTVDSQPPSKKKKRTDTLGDCMASNVAEIRDPDELEVYGREDRTSVQITSFTFEVCDSLLNIGPCGNVSIGEPAFLSEEFTSNTDPDLELVTTAGHGKNGALCVLQRSLRPQIATTFELPGVVDMWTVAAPSKLDEPPPAQPPDQDSSQDTMHAFLVLSRADSTMILQTGQEINEVDSSGFNTEDPTVFAGNLGLNKFIVQVYGSGVRLLMGLELVQVVPLDLSSPVVHASCADPYLVLLCADGQVIQLLLKEGRVPTAARLAISKPSISTKSRVTSLCVYRDVSGLFSGQVPGAEINLEPEIVDFDPTMKMEHIKREVDDEDELLYGDSDLPIILQPPEPEPADTDKNKTAPWWQRYLNEVKPSYWMLLARDNGALEMYSLPECKLNYMVRNVSMGPRVLADCLEIVPLGTAQPTNAPDLPVQQIQEVLVAPLGHLGNRPLLLLRLDEEILIYQAFHYPKGSPMPLRFRRLPHSMLARDRRSKSKKKAAESEETPDFVSPSISQLRYFSNIAGYNGVFVCGASPQWIFLTFRGELRTHPMHIDGPIPCFAPFHNVNCSQGFLYFNSKSELRICVLPTHLSYDAPWPCRKVPLRCTPHFVSYHLESKTYCIVTSTADPSNKVYRFNGEDKELSIEKRNERFPFPPVQRFSILLFSPVSWEVIPNTSTELDEWEHVTCLKNVSLAYEGAHSGLKGYIAVGTNYNYGEDITSRGRILIYDVIEVVPEPGQPLTKNRFKSVYAKEQKGPVTAIAHAMGFLVSAVGQKVYIWQLKDNDLVGVAFIDTQVYIHQMLAIKSLILVADVYKSISLLRFQEEYRTLSLVSRDFRCTEVYDVEFLIHNTQIGFLVSDREKNIVLYMYQPEARESYGGQRLLRKADFHMGQHINTFFRLKCKASPESSAERRLAVGTDKRHISMFATLDGGLGYVLPLSEKTYRRLLMLQNVLVNQVPHTAGLNPKAFRTYKSAARLLSNAARGIVDGELVWMFINLPANERWEVAKKIGTKVDEILYDLQDIEQLAAHF